LLVVYHDRYREVYSSDPAAAPGRMESIRGELIGHFDFVEPRPATDHELLLVHSQRHIDLVKACPLAYEIACLATGGAIMAADSAWKGEPAFGLIRPPGHHASRDSSWGFCYFNNVAVALEALRVAGELKKAVVIDIDLHYGDGTAEFASRNMSNVTYFHPEASNRQTYLDELSRFVASSKEQFELLAVSAGFDRHEQDWGGMLTTKDYHTIGKIVKEFAEGKCNGRRFGVLEGGYNHSVLGKNVKSFLDGFKSTFMCSENRTA